jgi:hypothetical protein
MADLLRSNVTVLDSWTEGGTNGKRYSTLRIQAAATAAGAGTATNKIQQLLSECRAFSTLRSGLQVTTAQLFQLRQTILVRKFYCLLEAQQRLQV